MKYEKKNYKKSSFVNYKQDYWVQVKIRNLQKIIFLYAYECDVMEDRRLSTNDFFCWYFYLSNSYNILIKTNNCS